MKKLLVLIMGLFVTSAAFSLTPVLAVHGNIGFGAGSEITKPDGKPIENSSWSFAGNFDHGMGIAVNFPLLKNFGVQTGLDFYGNNVGADYINSSTFGPASVKITQRDRFQYVSMDIPLLVTAKFGKVDIALGPYISIPLGNITYYTNLETVTDFGTQTTKNVSDEKHTYSNNSWGSVGLLIGAGYEFRIGPGDLVVGANYALDFIPIEIKDSHDNVLIKFTRRSLKVDVGYKFPLKF
ncbi:MAG: PorT family protein [Treponema sp.]|nr:PorT family protein [Treponema sp.]